MSVLVPNSNSLSEKDCVLSIRVLATQHDIDWELPLDPEVMNLGNPSSAIPFFQVHLPSVRPGLWFYLPYKPIYKSVNISWVINMGFIIYDRASIMSINKLALISRVPKSHMDYSMDPEHSGPVHTVGCITGEEHWAQGIYLPFILSS